METNRNVFRRGGSLFTTKDNLRPGVNAHHLGEGAADVQQNKNILGYHLNPFQVLAPKFVISQLMPSTARLARAYWQTGKRHHIIDHHFQVVRDILLGSPFAQLSAVVSNYLPRERHIPYLQPSHRIVSIAGG